MTKSDCRLAIFFAIYLAAMAWLVVTLSAETEKEPTAPAMLQDVGPPTLHIDNVGP